MRKFVLLLACSLPFAAHAAYDNAPVKNALNLFAKEWRWQNFGASSTQLTQDYSNKNRYFVSYDLQGNGVQNNITIYGTKQKPEFAVIESYNNYDEDKPFIRLDKTKGLKRLKSNCNFKNINQATGKPDHMGYNSSSLEIQQVYQLPKPTKNATQLYMAANYSSSVVITEVFNASLGSTAIITPYKNKLGSYINEFGWNTDKRGRTVKCTVS